MLVSLLLSAGCGGGSGGTDPAGSTTDAAKEELLDVYTTFMQNAFLMDVYFFSAQGFDNPLLGSTPDARDCFSGGTLSMVPPSLLSIPVGSTVEVRFSGCRADATVTKPGGGLQAETSSTRDGVAQYRLKSASGDYWTTWSSFAVSYDLVLADFRTSTSIKIGAAAPLVFGSSMSGSVGYAYTGWNRDASTGAIAMTTTELSLNVSQGTGASFGPKYRNASISWTDTPTTHTRSGHLDLVIGDGALAGKTVSYVNLVPAVFDLSAADLTAQLGQAQVQIFDQPRAGLDRFTFGKSLVFARYSPSTVTLEYDLDGDGCLDARGELTRAEIENAFLTGGGIARSAIRSLTGPCTPNPTR